MGVYNLAVTCPPEKVNGFLVSGWLAPHHRRDFAHPKELLEELEGEVGLYESYPKSWYSKMKGKSFISDLSRILERLRKSGYW